MGRGAHKTRITSWIPTQSRWLHLHNAPTYSTNVCGSFENLIRFGGHGARCGAPFSVAEKHTQSKQDRRHYHLDRARTPRWTLFTVFFFGCAAVVFASAVCIFLYYVIRNCFEPSFAVIANCIVAHNRIDCTKCNKKFVPISYRHRSGSGDIAFVCRRRLVRCSSELILLFSYSFALFLHYCHLPGRLLDRHTTYPFARSRSARMARRALESGWGSYTATHI